MTSADATLPIVVTAGEPAGIGPELCLALADTEWSGGLVIVGDPQLLDERARMLGKTIDIVAYDPAVNSSGTTTNGTLLVLGQELANREVCGHPDPVNAPVLLGGLQRAVKGCLNSEFAALVTAPLQKSVLNDAGYDFTGHTEFIAEQTSSSTPVMLLVAGDLRVALASTHLPLREVPDYLSTERLIAVLTVLDQDLRRRFGIDNPAIVVCGLNPHAGEGGHLGREEAEIIQPAIAAMQARGLNLRGPMPADTAFTAAAGHADAILAMYHDQGLPVLKYAGFGTAVNVTLGLPIIRTSVDHGTALDIAGTGTADTGSLIAAIELAAKMAAR